MEMVCFQTLTPIDAFLSMRKAGEEASYLYYHVYSQIIPSSCLCSILPTICFLWCFKKQTDKAIGTVAAVSV